VLLPLPHRHCVSTIPKALRALFARERPLLALLPRCAFAAVGQHLRERAGRKDGSPGFAASIQTFGAALPFHPPWSVVLGWPSFRVVSSNLPRPCVWLVVAVVGYHALFGPAMLPHFLTHKATRNDDIALRLWPHVIHWIDSFE
jgi:hypothetical protein